MKSTLLAATAALLAALSAAAAPIVDASTTDDSIITAKVKSALLQEPQPRSAAIKVRTVHGVVQLTGMVDTPELKQRAEVIASTTEGVTDVHNHLKVRTTGAVAAAGDSAVVANVRRALNGHASTQARNIDVKPLNEDTVELVGVVGSPDEKATAARIAVGVDGVRHVENSLTVKALAGRDRD